MKPEIATIWTEALRSGKYKQGKIVLRDSDDNYCCLGVLSQLAVEAGVIPEPRFQEDGGMYIYNEISMSELNGAVREWSGVRDSLGKYNNWDDSLSMLNDFGTTFVKIADIIDANVEKL